MASLTILLVAACAEPDTRVDTPPGALPATAEQGFRGVVERVGAALNPAARVG
jgi:hypothetical protein